MKNSEQKIQEIYSKLFISWSLTILLFLWFIFFIYPEINIITSKKQEVISKILQYEELKQKWLKYEEFISLIKDESLKNNLSKESKDLFDKTLLNNTSKDYMSFLEEKEKYIDEVNKSNLIKNRDEKLSKVLPSYTEGYSVDWNMTDLSFVNYVESLLRTFQLQTNSKIWIEKVVSIWDNKDKDINNQLYYIPLELDLTWRKSHINWIFSQE